MCYCACSYLYPDGRDVNPDLTSLCEPAQRGKVKVTEVNDALYTLLSIYQTASSVLRLDKRQNIDNILRCCLIVFCLSTQCNPQ